MLWQRSLVMRDGETGSLWSHILGECMDGELKGTALEVIPSVMTTWGDWLERHPGTTVLELSRTARDYTADAYRNPRRFVFGVVAGGEAKAYPFDHLAKHPVVEETLGGVALLVAFDPKTARAFAYRREVGGRTLTFKRPEAGGRTDHVTDAETGSLWDLWSGQAIEGTLKGKRLQPLAGLVSFRKAWDAFHPESKWEGSEGER